MKINIPSLWGNNKIILPQDLSNLYIDKLISIDAFDHAKNYIRKEKTDGAVGGVTSEETYRHFAEKFTNSCARLQKVMIDPLDNFKKVTNHFYSSFSTGNIALLDSPCGTGAGALTLLYVLRELRLTKNLPNLPLDITILACDYSDTALDVYKELLSKALPHFSQVGINVTIKQTDWNAFSIKSTQELMDEFKRIEADEYFVLVSAFSGISQEQLTLLKQSFQHMQGCLSVVPFTIIHVEPKSKKGKKLLQMLMEVYQYFKDDRKILECKDDALFEWIDPVSERDIRSSVMVSLNYRGE